MEELPPLHGRMRAICALCRTELEARNGRSLTAALACALGAFFFLFPANLLPILRVHAFGLHTSNVIAGGILLLWNHGWVLLAGLSFLFVVVTPFLFFGALSLSLGALRFTRRPPWIGRVFRRAMALELWAMIDVYLLASFVGYYRLAHVSQLHITVEIGAYCLIAAAFLSLLTRATLDKRSVWRLIGPEAPAPHGEHALSCTSCDLIQPLSRERHPCPRCGALLHSRKPGAAVRTTALLVAAFILFFPANILPMNVSSHLGTTTSYTIFTGVKDLFQAGLWPLGILIFCTSIVIPVAKIFALAWCVASAHFGWTRHLVFKTRMLQLIAEIGRWSKTDPFTIVFFVPLMTLGAFASSSAGWGAIAFVAMTFFTMLASQFFDPRLMWDAAEQSRHE